MKRLNSKIHRIGRQKSGRGQNRIQGRGGKTGRKQAIGQPLKKAYGERRAQKGRLKGRHGSQGRITRGKEW